MALFRSEVVVEQTRVDSSDTFPKNAFKDLDCLGLDFLVNYRDLMYRYTREDLQAALRHYLDPDRFVIAVAGPPA